jgi:phosphate transport system substrate-binding protein
MAIAVAVGLGYAPVAAAQPVSMPEALNIEISNSGQAIFDGWIPELAAVSGLRAPPALKYATALATLRDFCRGIGGTSPDIVLTTRRLRPALAAECTKNGVEHMVQVKLGVGALILAVRRNSPLVRLSARQVYLALARDVPDKNEFRRNLAIRWSDIDRSLPPQDIRFQVPSRDDGDRALFDALVLEGGCRAEPMVQLIFSADQRTSRCTTMRLDRVREIQHSQAMRALLDAPEGTVGVVTYLNIVQSEGQLVGLALDGTAPTFDSIMQGEYDEASVYWLYAKRGQALHGRPPAIDAAVERVVVDALTEPVIGPDGTLAKLGLMPIPPEERDAQRALFFTQPGSFGIMGSIMPIVDWVAYTASAARSLLGLALGDASSQNRRGDVDFVTLMDIAGYKTQELHTSVGIFPSAGMEFGVAREMSEADQDYLDRTLAQDTRQRPDALSAMQRQIVRSVLDVSEANGYQFSRVQIELLPLPSVQLFVSPADAPINSETSLLLHAIERLEERQSEMSR